MATIHHLAARHDQTTDRTADHNDSTARTNRPSDRSATIILFTGVRYERWPEPVEAPQTELEAALSEPVDETGAPRSKGPAKGPTKNRSKA
jgi:hypothetical protein